MCFEKAFSGELASNPLSDGVLDLGALNAEKYVILSESNQSILPLLRERVGVRVQFLNSQWIATKTFGFLAMTLSLSSHVKPNTFTPEMTTLFTPLPPEVRYAKH